jgi:hypothetical protein
VGKPENSFRASLHRHLPLELHHEKMNNPYSSGTADDWYSGNRGDLWVEYKFLPVIPPQAGVWLINPKLKKPELSVLQQNWLRGRYLEGRNVAVIVGVGRLEGGVILRDQEWEWEYTPQMFRDRLVPRKDIAQWITQTTTR